MVVQMEKSRPVTLEVESLKFNVFKPEEIRKFSVCKITNTTSFDSIGNPVSGGLYDVSMGPSTRREVCSTCMNDQHDCIGHFGHIELIMPCYNPFFMKTIATILRATCFGCSRLQVSERLKEIVEMQLRLVDAGYDIEAQELEDQKILYASVMKPTKKYLEDQEEGMNTSEKENKTYTKMMKKYAKLMEREPVNHCGGTKNTEAIRMAIVNSTIAASSSATTTKCIYCHSKMRRVRYSYKKLVITVSKRDLDTSQMQRGEEEDSKKPPSAKTIIASECREMMQEIFDKEGAFLRMLYPVLQGAIDDNFDLFFMDVIPVVPPLFRPPNRVRDALLEHPQTKSYFTVVQANNQLRYILALKKSEDGNELLTTPALRQEAENIYKAARGESAQEKIFFKWEELQTAVDMTLDKTMGGKMNTEGAGLKQLIEKKEGLIRMHMMGKRVNFAARTVITPDPNINIDQIGVPEAFALKLTYPVPVTPWNVLQLRKMVMNGPDVHPGACYIESGTGQKVLISKDESKREAMADTLLKPERNDGIKIVHRHLVNGDVLLLNRQPTLHRPSIMGHKARILKNEKTFRLHYSNCKSYNADFDGDEMNAHFPQNEVGRSEAYNLANVANNYLVPKDGTPLGGLIQDHMISGVKISLRGRFFSRDDYQQLVYQGLSHKTGDILLLPPTIIKPIKLWSGKQIFSTIILNLIPENKPAINLTSTAKIGATAWEMAKPRKWKAGGTKLEGNSMSEAEVVIRGGKLLVGILDKNHYGATAYSLIHCMFELYGGDVSTQLLSSLTKMFTIFLQWEGFTLGVHDILVLAEADKKRTEIVNESRTVGKAATCQVLDIPEDTPDDELVTKLEEAYAKDPKFRTTLDRKYKSTMDSFTNNINKTCLPAGLLCKFPDNNLQLMVMSGAKGSTVNTMQISCLLGQIELEGKRPPVMISGKSLPSFPMFECSPKSGGFIDGRFMTGIQPQDFFFHCMAGREGLIDTAVKTSRSGYLQRCLIKHLEGLTVSYDGTVRDSDNTVVQFMYGEDGMDILKSQFLKLSQMSFLNDNRDAIVNDEILSSLRNLPEIDEKIHKIMKRVKTYKKRHGSTVQRPMRSENRLVKKCPSTVTSQFPPNRFFGAVSEAAEEILDKFIKTSDCDDEKVRDMMYVKSARCLAEPGEPVGLIAAQSIGEPSTQMTLNTFHFAGRGDMNVTLGIPRLREILMMASANIKTPSMEIPFLNQNSETSEKTSEKFRIRLNQVTLADVIEFVKVKSWITLKPTRARNYEFTFNFLPHEAYKNQFMVKPKKIVKFMHQGFINKMFKFIERASKDAGAFIDKEEKESKKSKKRNDDDDGGEDDPGMPAAKKKGSAEKGSEDSSDEDDLADDADATDERKKARQLDEKDYEEPDSDEEKRDAIDDDSEDEFDMAKVKLEVNDEFDVSVLKREVEPNNADVEQLEEIERKEDEDLADVQGDDDILKFLTERSAKINSSIIVRDFIYDKEKYRWCCVKFEMPVKFKNIDMTNVLREAAKSSIIWQVPKIKRAFTHKQNDVLIVTTDGINIGAMFEYDKILDLNKLYTNDIHAVARTYGIEAAARVVVKEVQNVFKVYGITVDPRHLSLISDYMTFDGTFKPLNRKGIESSASPLQQISFESALQFLKNAVVQGRTDKINSPSSCLMVGHPCKTGTGSFGLVNDLSYVLKSKN